MEQTKAAKGIVYTLINPSMPDLIKIGSTEKTAYERAEELYTTGVPTPFEVAYSVPSEYPKTLEDILHIFQRGGSPARYGNLHHREQAERRGRVPRPASVQHFL